MPNCLVPGCKNIRGIGVLSFFQVPNAAKFPNKADLAKKWLKQMNVSTPVSQFTYGHHRVVCEMHFEPEHFCEGVSRVTAMNDGRKAKKALRPTALPTLYLSTEDPAPRAQKKSKSSKTKAGRNSKKATKPEKSVPKSSKKGSTVKKSERKLREPKPSKKRLNDGEKNGKVGKESSTKAKPEELAARAPIKIKLRRVRSKKESDAVADNRKKSVSRNNKEESLSPPVKVLSKKERKLRGPKLKADVMLEVRKKAEKPKGKGRGKSKDKGQAEVEPEMPNPKIQESVFNVKMINDQVHYLVKWKDETEPDWVHFDDVEHDLVDQFLCRRRSDLKAAKNSAGKRSVTDDAEPSESSTCKKVKTSDKSDATTAAMDASTVTMNSAAKFDSDSDSSHSGELKKDCADTSESESGGPVAEPPSVVSVCVSEKSEVL